MMRQGHDSTPFVMEYMEKHADSLQPVGVVAQRVGITAGTASGCLSRLTDKGMVERVAVGVYRYKGGAKTANGTAESGYMVEIIGTTRDGHPLGEGEDGTLWVLHERGGK